MIEVFADVWCPFAHVGVRRFMRRRWAARRPDLLLRVRAWPLELVNGEALDADHVAAQVDDLRAQIAPELFRGFRPEVFPSSTLPALDLIDDAYAVAGSVGERASMAVRDALFERGEDIGDPTVLTRLRLGLGVGPPSDEARSNVLADWREGQRRGVIGSPHFFVGDRGFFCPSLRIERSDGQTQLRIDGRRFDDFFDECAA